MDNVLFIVLLKCTRRVSTGTLLVTNNPNLSEKSGNKQGLWRASSPSTRARGQPVNPFLQTALLVSERPIQRTLHRNIEN